MSTNPSKKVVVGTDSRVERFIRKFWHFYYCTRIHLQCI